MSLIIPDLFTFERLKNNFRIDGYNCIHILSDFDRTLTYGTTNGIRTPSIIAQLRNGNYLIEGYAEKAHALFDYYHPIEVSSTISLERKKDLMIEWFHTHTSLLFESGLSFADLEHIVEHGPIRFRDGISALLDLLYEHEIPLIIFSASGCGDVIPLYFKKIGKDYNIISYITNRFQWDNQGKAIGTIEPMIHSCNKDEGLIRFFPEIAQKIKTRRNVILMGDTIEDCGMVNGFSYRNLLKIGFFNHGYNQSLDEFKRKFDIVIVEGDFSFIVKFVRELL